MLVCCWTSTEAVWSGHYVWSRWRQLWRRWWLLLKIAQFFLYRKLWMNVRWRHGQAQSQYYLASDGNCRTEMNDVLRCCRRVVFVYIRRSPCDERVTWPSSWRRLRRVSAATQTYDFPNHLSTLSHIGPGSHRLRDSNALYQSYTTHNIPRTQWIVVDPSCSSPFGTTVVVTYEWYDIVISSSEIFDR